MCRGISVEIGLADQVMCWFGDPDETGPDRDSHTKIREFHGVREATTMASDRKRAPAEWLCHGNIEDAADYRLEWDEAKPEWWDDDRHMPQARAKLASEIARRVKHAKATGVWPGSLTLRGVVSLLDYIASVGGGLDLEGATVAEHAFPSLALVGDWLNLEGATVSKHAFPVLASIGDWLDLSGATVPAHAFPVLASIGSTLCLNRAKVAEHAFPALVSVRA